MIEQEAETHERARAVLGVRHMKTRDPSAYGLAAASGEHWALVSEITLATDAREATVRERAGEGQFGAGDGVSPMSWELVEMSQSGEDDTQVCMKRWLGAS